MKFPLLMLPAFQAAGVAAAAGMVGIGIAGAKDRSSTRGRIGFGCCDIAGTLRFAIRRIGFWWRAGAAGALRRCRLRRIGERLRRDLLRPFRLSRHIRRSYAVGVRAAGTMRAAKSFRINTSISPTTALIVGSPRLVGTLTIFSQLQASLNSFAQSGFTLLFCRSFGDAWRSSDR